MYCRFCGKDLPEGAKFCNRCGKPVEADVDPVTPDPDPLAPPLPDDAPAPVISKREYLATHGSHRAKKLMRAAWIVFAICTVLGVACTVFLFKRNDILLWIRALPEVLPPKESVILALVFSLFVIFALMDTVFGVFACMRKSIGWTVMYLLFSILIGFILHGLIYLCYGWEPVDLVTALTQHYLTASAAAITVGKVFDLIASVCMLIFMRLISKEYKKYIREH